MSSHIENSMFRRKILCTSIAFGLLSTPFYASAQQDSGVEEVVVTGSFIRRSEGIIAASPITSLTADDITDQGTLNMAQIVQNMTFNNGSGVTNSIQASGASSNSAAFNLRGLGTSATLQLIDGKRVTNPNVQWLLPAIAIQRLDIVTDGAAALYGTDAVAGVVNVLPYTSYEGLKIEHFNEQDSRGDMRDQTTSFLWGKALGNDVDLVVAGSFRHNGTLEWTDRPKLALAGLTDNSGANPANWNVPQRDDTGALLGSTASTPDPICGSDPVTDPLVQGGNKFGTLALGRCWFPFADTRDFLEQKTQASLFSNINWEVNEDLSLSGQLLWGRWQGHGRQNQGNPGTRFGDLPTVRGELPGNPFRAVAGDGRELFAQPLLDGNGMILADPYGNQQPMRGPDGSVMLAANQFANIANDPTGGVPFNEDVPFSSAWLPFGLANTNPAIFGGPGSDQISRKENDERDMRISFGADFTVPFLDGWEGTVDYVYGQRNVVTAETQHFSFSAVEQGLNCDQVNDAGACFNPFGAADDSPMRTPQAVADAIYTRDRIDDKDTLQTLDLVINGAISPGGFALPGGTIGAAFGYQRRDLTDENVPTFHQQRDDRLNSIAAFPTKFSRTSDSYFAEFSFPVLSNVEISASVRDEQFSSGQGDVVSKFGITYSPADWVTLRATQGEAFIVPTLNQLNAPDSCALSNVDDLFTTFSGFITSCRTGNPNLVSETSDSISVGIDLTPMDGLDIHLTYSETDFVDRIVDTTTQDIVRADFAKFQLATGFAATDANPFPSIQQLTDWVNNPLSDPRIQRDPNDIETTTRINRSETNASTMLVQAWDIQANYRFDLDAFGLGSWGEFRTGLNATYVDTYTWQESILTPVREAKGHQNNSFGAVPVIPEWRANLSLGWSLGNHSVSTTVRYVDEVQFDANEFGFQRFLRPENLWTTTDVVRAWTQTDMFYAYNDLEVYGGNATLSLGARNLFDREAQKTGMIAGAISQIQNPFGRMIYARVNYEF
ncbi:MAG: iron complex outermembrane receptor protein [Pseudohongiellaceae bacterium]|jgi:iron complex outermembrane receptor protein